MAHKIFRPARDRLAEIWDYTERLWGEEQADRYLTGLALELDKIAASPYRWRRVKAEGLEGVYVAKYRHHFIFYRRLLGSELGVISILHENMDLPGRLKEDYGRAEGE